MHVIINLDMVGDNVEEKALELLNILYDNGFEGYIVGGYVRDKMLGVKVKDVDICTSATPMDLMKLFDGNITGHNYGSIGIIYKNSLFDVTTYRKDIKYDDNRNPVRVKYIKNVHHDLLRRDFTVNTFCIDRNGKFHDFLGVKSDFDNRIIRSVGNPRYKLKEDVLRILRAVRFATLLDFDIDEKTKYYIKKYGYLLSKLSYNRKKQELDKIFMSKNCKKGIDLLVSLGLDKYLELDNLSKVSVCSNIIGIWSQLEVDSIYPFTKIELNQMKSIRKLLSKEEISKYDIYKYGLYISMVVYQIKGFDLQTLNEVYNNIPIKCFKDIDVNSLDIAKCLNREVGSYLKDILNDIEVSIVNGDLNNKNNDIIEYVKNKYLED